MIRVAFIALVAVGGELLKPGTDILFRYVVPLGVGLQTQVDAHLRVLLLLACRSLYLLTGALALVSSHRLCQFCCRVQFVIKLLDIGDAEEHVAPHASVWLDASIAHPLIEHQPVNAQSPGGLARIDEGETPTPRFAHHIYPQLLTLL